MSDTPETDAHEVAFRDFLSGRQRCKAPLDWPAVARSLERRLQEAQRERDEAVSMLRIIGEECVLATGLPGGDRVVTLTRVRQIICERDAALRDALRYRWLREDEETLAVFQPRKHGHIAFNGDALDTIIDAAIAEKGKP